MVLAFYDIFSAFSNISISLSGVGKMANIVKICKFVGRRQLFKLNNIVPREERRFIRLEAFNLALLSKTVALEHDW